MISSKEEFNNYEYKEVASEKISSEIDLLEFYSFFKKYLKLILIATIFTACLGFYKFRTSKKIWEGEFKIVLSTPDNQTGVGNSLRNFGIKLPNKQNSNDLMTELEILKSQSVLYPAYEAFKKIRINNGLNSENWEFGSFKSNVEIKLKEGTRVLAVKYKSPNKELINPALEKISAIYQAYSYQDKDEELKKISTYLDKQISKYKNESALALERVNEYSQKYDLSYSLNDDLIVVNTELKRIENANLIREIDQTINYLNEMYEDDEKFIYYATNSLPSDLLAEIKRIDNRMVNNYSVFKEGDISFEALKELRKVLIRRLKNETFGLLNSRRLAYQAEMQSAERPSGVINNFKQLARNLTVSISTLKGLEREKNSVLLEKAKEKTAWEVITDISVIDTPISPKKSKILSTYLFFGFFSSFIIFFLYEKRKNLVFSPNVISSTLKLPTILDLSKSPEKDWQKTFKLALKGKLNFDEGKSIGIQISDELPQDIIEKITKVFKNNLINKVVIYNEDFIRSSDCDIELLVVCLGYLKYNNMKKIKQLLDLNANNFIGLAIFNNEMFNK
tara:strand:+ start:14728 stop:16416 length:1689 start_codon:yes stop_codon:yes gene_type:complete